jgi:putative ABC transport system permease protein
MRLRELLNLVMGNLLRMRTRVAMTAAGVAIGTAAVVVLMSLGAGLQRQATLNLASGTALTEVRVMGAWEGMGPATEGPPTGGTTTRRSSRDQRPRLDDRVIAEIAEIPGVELVTPVETLRTPGEFTLGAYRGYASLWGVEPVYLDALPVMSGTLTLNRGEVVVGARIAESFQDPAMQGRPRSPDEEPLVTNADLLGATIKIPVQRINREDGSAVQQALQLKVVGILRPSGWRNDYALYMSLRDAVQYNSWMGGQRRDPGREGYPELLVRTSTMRDTLSVEEAVSDLGFMVYSERQQVEQSNAFFASLQAIMGGIGAVALLVAAFGIANTMLMAVYERTREIGLLKAIGASNRDVMSIFLGESGAIGLIGGAAGIVLGLLVNGVLNIVGLSSIANQMGTRPDAGLSVAYMPLWLPLFALGFSVVIGLISGAYPSNRAAGLSPLSALKYE